MSGRRQLKRLISISMEIQVIQNKIYTIRGQRVMLDRDLAEMYGVETRTLKQAVKRSPERFEGDDFMFTLSEYEINQLVSQFVIPSKSYFGGAKPYVFTELGVAMLSSILHSKTAIEINRAIMRAFVTVRQLLINPPIDKVTELQSEVKALKHYMDEILIDQNDINEDTRMQLELINQTLAEL
jgi:hypothetical protein